MTLLKKFPLLFVIVFSPQTLLAEDDDFVFYSELTRDWYRGGRLFRMDIDYRRQ